MESSSSKENALSLSFSRFMNSFLRERSQFQLRTSKEEASIEFELAGVQFQVPVSRTSRLGYFQYHEKIKVTEDGRSTTVGIVDCIEKLSTALAIEQKGADTHKFKSRVFESISVMKDVLENCGLNASWSNQDFIVNEQGLVLGHSLHPTPKSRSPFTMDDSRLYSPEFKNSFSLKWYLASPKIVHKNSATSFKDKDWTKRLVKKEGLKVQLNEKSGQDWIPFPVHPWQEAILLKRKDIQSHISQELLVGLGCGVEAWQATSSVRTVYNRFSPYMLKFSLSVKLTNSIRHLLPKEVDRGLQLFDVVNTSEFSVFKKEFPEFKVICDPSYLCLKDLDGNEIAESVVVCRENPFVGEKQKGQVVLAALTQEDPRRSNWLIDYCFAGKVLDDQKAIRWFSGFCSHVLRPLITLQADFGVLLGAHQQNLVLTLKEGFPVGCFFRDCQGTGYTELGFKKFSQQVSSIKEENENVVSEVMGHALFGYYLIVNSTFAVISSLSQGKSQREDLLLQKLRDFLNSMNLEDHKDKRFLVYLLESQSLYYKGNFFCTIDGINENDTADPLAIYTKVDNPIFAAEQETLSCKV